MKGQCQVIGPTPPATPRVKIEVPLRPCCMRALDTHRHCPRPWQPSFVHFGAFTEDEIYCAQLHLPKSPSLFSPLRCCPFSFLSLRLPEQILSLVQITTIKGQSLNMQIFYFYPQYYFNINKMKVASPFVEFIPDCKRSMRRLRKKIYKFITSKNYTRRQQPPADLMRVLTHTQIPVLLQEQLAKRKNNDLSAIRNLAVPRMALKDIAAIALAQERTVSGLQQEWLEDNRVKSKLKATHFEGLRDNFSKRTLSSTEFEYDQEEELCADSSGLFAREESSVVQNLNQDIEFHHFERGNSFLQIESSILSQENLFRFQQ